MKVLIGIGNELGGDDAVGLYVAKLIDGENGWIGFRCGTAPENFIGKIERLDPELVVLVDAAEMGIEPGEFREIEPEYADTIFASTHSIPISFLLKWLRQSVGKVFLIGIQAKSFNIAAR
ncbi:hydrogenase 3 maturation endopeptidase HyCI [Candidatus Poribacteria bacterium]|nr:hydrogenase 3 maturation endopeptidase HyCI [Candidatus Poribacteria bacterium]